MASIVLTLKLIKSIRFWLLGQDFYSSMILKIKNIAQLEKDNNIEVFNNN